MRGCSCIIAKTFSLYFTLANDYVDVPVVKGEELCIEDIEGGAYSPDNCTSSEAANTDLLVPFSPFLPQHPHIKTLTSKLILSPFTHNP